MALPDTSYVRTEIVVAARQHVEAYWDMLRLQDIVAVQGYMSEFYRGIDKVIETLIEVHDQHLGLDIPREDYDFSLAGFLRLSDRDVDSLDQGDSGSYWAPLSSFWRAHGFDEVVKPDVPEEKEGPFCTRPVPDRCLYDYNFGALGLDTPRTLLSLYATCDFDLEGHAYDSEDLARAAVTTYENLLFNRSPISFPR